MKTRKQRRWDRFHGRAIVEWRVKQKRHCLQRLQSRFGWGEKEYVQIIGRVKAQDVNRTVYCGSYRWRYRLRFKGRDLEVIWDSKSGHMVTVWDCRHGWTDSSTTIFDL